MKICTIIGARPQFIKAATISRAITEHNLHSSSGIQIKEVIIHTGQHFDQNMSDVFFEEMQIPHPDYFLDIHGLSHGAMTGQMVEKIEALLMKEIPDFVLVYGDTNTTLAGALAASKIHIPVAHVEAGLRSFNRKMPEEINRVITDHISNVLFCPTDNAVENLKNEGIVNNLQTGTFSKGVTRAVANVGDVMLDAAMFYKELSSEKSRILEKIYSKNGMQSGSFILSTIHRAENTDDSTRLKTIFNILEEIAEEIPIILPLHPRTRGKLKDINYKGDFSNLLLVDPVSYFGMLELLANCSLVMTDSGGLQKEAFFFKKYCITLRNETEWVELVEHGYNTVAGIDREKILKAVDKYKNQFIATENLIYGDGTASKKIVQALQIN